jgi:hypothetical protein
MRRWLRWLIPLSLLLTNVASGQTLLPTRSYKLHAEREQYSSNRFSTLLYLLPDQALLIVNPLRDGKWLVKRIAAWDTGTPTEESLAFAAQTLEEGSSDYDDLRADLAGKYAVIRIKSIARKGQKNSAVVVLVDLRSFTIVSRLTTTEPLIAASYWSFSKNGLLIATAMTDRTMTPPHPKPEWKYQTLTDNYEAAAFTLPDWQPSMSCRYQLFLDTRAGSANMKFYLSKVDDGCAGLVASAGVPTARQLPGGPMRPTAYAMLAGPTCGFTSESPSADLALYGCRTGHDYLDGTIVTTNSRNLTVLGVPDGKSVLTVPLPHNTKPYPAVLANASGHTWLLLLRDSVKLEAYQLPHP